MWRMSFANRERRNLGDASTKSRSQGDESGAYVPVTSVVASRLRTPGRHEKDVYQSSVCRDAEGSYGVIWYC